MLTLFTVLLLTYSMGALLEGGSGGGGGGGCGLYSFCHCWTREADLHLNGGE
jgi:hypothetical protein